MDAPPRPSPVRERILEAAVRRFYAEGTRAVSADRLIADAGVSKVTFYRHFRSKDDLVAAYVAERAAREVADVAAQREAHPDDPGAVLRWYADLVGALSCTPGFRGCPFINVAAEHPDPAHPARRAVDAHRAWLRGQVVELVEALGVRDPHPVADALVMLRDGAMVSGYLGEHPEVVAGRLRAAGAAVLRAAGAAVPGGGGPD